VSYSSAEASCPTFHPADGRGRAPRAPRAAPDLCVRACWAPLVTVIRRAGPWVPAPSHHERTRGTSTTRCTSMSRIAFVTIYRAPGETMSPEGPGFYCSSNPS
jgi:hypothetical protein